MYQFLKWIMLLVLDLTNLYLNKGHTTFLLEVLEQFDFSY